MGRAEAIGDQARVYNRVVSSAAPILKHTAMGSSNGRGVCGKQDCPNADCRSRTCEVCSRPRI